VLLAVSFRLAEVASRKATFASTCDVKALVKRRTEAAGWL